MENKGRRVVISVGLFLLITITCGLLIKGIIDAALYNRFPDRGVPRINIDLNGVSLSEINEGTKDVKYEGNGLQIYNDSKISEYGGVEIKGRGNGTWTQEKKPYQIKFEDKVDMFGMGKARKWYLLANASDGTNLRSEVASDIAKMLEMSFVIDGVFTELYMDGDYCGLYYLTQAVEISKNSVDLKDSLGILVELDNLYWEDEENYTTHGGDKMVIKDVVSKDQKKSAIEDFLQSYNALEMAVKDKDFEMINKLADVDSFAKYYLLSEFSVNPDAYWTSFYFYKDGPNDKIHVGPGWDFDLAFGNRRWWNWLGEDFYSTDENMIRKRELLTQQEYTEMDLSDWFSSGDALSRIIFDLMDVSEFQYKVKEVFRDKMSGRKIELLKNISNVIEKIGESALSNDLKWLKEDCGYKCETEEMIEWIKRRYDHFEEFYGDNDKVGLNRFL